MLSSSLRKVQSKFTVRTTFRAGDDGAEVPHRLWRLRLGLLLSLLCDLCLIESFCTPDLDDDEAPRGEDAIHDPSRQFRLQLRCPRPLLEPCLLRRSVSSWPASGDDVKELLLR